MVEQLVVYTDQSRVGTLTRTKHGSVFAYDGAYRDSGGLGIATHLPIDQSKVIAEGVANLPAFFANLLPEGIMRDVLHRRKRIAHDDLFAVLAETGADATGDVTVRKEDEPPPGHQASLSDLDFAAIIQGQVDRPPSIPGVQPKVSVGSLVRMQRVRAARRAYIVKPEPPQFPHLVENEHFFMRASRASGIETAKVEVVQGVLCSERFDRTWDRHAKRLRELHFEDALQLADRYPPSKYSLSLREVAETVMEVCQSRLVVLQVLELYVFSYLIGNADLHCKNIGFMRDRNTRLWRRSPAYDLLSTLPYADHLDGADRTALPLFEEEFGKFTRQDFTDFGQRFGIAEAAVAQMLDRLTKAARKWLPGVQGLPFEPKNIELLHNTIEQRLASLA